MNPIVIGIIILTALGQLIAFVVCVRRIRALTERNESFWEETCSKIGQQLVDERQWWQNQLEMAHNRYQFPELAQTMTATKDAEPGDVSYVDDAKEFELESERRESNAATETSA